MNECTHTSDWWKQMVACVCCGALYSDEEAERIANASSKAHRVFTSAQTAIIEKLAQQEMDSGS